MAKRKTQPVTDVQVLEELGRIGFAQAGDFTGAELKFSNKLKALELLGKHLGLFDGRGGRPVAENNLLEALERCAGEELVTDDLPEL